MCNFQINAEEFNPKVVFQYRARTVEKTSVHSHDFLSIHYIVSGRCRFLVNDQIFTVHKDDIMIINPGVPHSPLAEDPETDVNTSIFYLGIDDLYIKGYPKCFVPISSAVIPLRKFQQEVYSCYHEIILTQEKKDACWPLMTKVLAQQMLVWVLKELSPQNSSSIQDYFQLKTYDKQTIAQTITSYFQENYMKKISVEEIARSSYLSTTYITKIYKEITGDTPINYLIRLRMEKALEILREGHFSIQDVAKKVGYDDPYYFSKLFKKRFGISPSSYKRQEQIASGNDPVESM